MADDATAHRATIRQFVEAQVEQLGGQDAAAQQSARRALIDVVRGRETPSPSFMSVYAEELNNALMQLPQDAELRVRLNAAIVVEGVARRANNTRLMDATVRCLEDPHQSVVLWGMKAAQWVVPPVVQVRPQNPLLPALVEAAKQHDWGPVIEEAYEALMLDIAGTPVAPGMVRAVLPSMQELLEHRIEQYAGGIPENPTADNHATLFLSHPRAWPVQQPDERVRTMQALSDLIALAGEHVANDPPQRDQLVHVIVGAAGAIWSIGQTIDHPPLIDAVSPLQNINSNTPSQEIQRLTQPVLPAIQAIPEFAEVTPRPEIQAAAAPERH